MRRPAEPRQQAINPVHRAARVLRAGRSSRRPSRSPRTARTATSLARYRRQELIKAIEAHTGRKLITYVADLSAAMTREERLERTLRRGGPDHDD
jgi:hypothetical protein